MALRACRLYTAGQTACSLALLAAASSSSCRRVPVCRQGCPAATRFKRQASHPAVQLVRAGIAALACSGWAAPAPVASGGHSSPRAAATADGGGSAGALGVRKQARDIMSGGWSRGGSAKSPEACAPPPPPRSRPQHVQGARVTYTQRPASKGKELSRRLQREVSFDAYAHSDVQRLSIADDSCDDDEYYHRQRSGRSGGSSGRWLTGSSSGRWLTGSQSSHVSARPSSPDVVAVQDGDALGGRPSTPDGAALLPRAPTQPRLLCEAGAMRRSLEHLDLTGNRQAQ